MARALRSTELEERDGADGDWDAAFSQVPSCLRPSAWQWWLADVPATPDPSCADHVEAAYGVTVDQLAGTTPDVPSSHWRQIVADQRHRDAYLAWLTERGLTYTAEATGERHSFPGWRFGDVERWEVSR